MLKKFKKTIIFISLILLVVIVFYLIPEKPTIFTFTNSDTGESLNGEVFLDNYYLGYLEQGNISVPSLENVPLNLKFIGEQAGEKFEVKYSFPKDYNSYKIVPFSLTQEEIDFYKEYYNHKQEDAFLNVLEPHFKKTPITWKIEDSTQCWKTEENKIRLAFSEIEESSEGYIKFQEVYSNPDILIMCYTNFTEKYNEYKEELEDKKTCKNITFDTNKIAATNIELEISEIEYKVSAKIILQESNKTIWEVCKINKEEIGFNPEIIFNPNLKLSDYLIGEGGPTESFGNLILQGEARFFGDKDVIVSCTSGFPLPEIHEFLHVLGFDHIIEINELPTDFFGDKYVPKEYVGDVLSPYQNCINQTKINQHYSSCLKYIYSNGEIGDCSGVKFMFE